ncbi:MAG: RDD family protein [Desulfovibrio sp.]
MICPKCKAEMPDQATYCVQCGAKLPGSGHPLGKGTRGGRPRAPRPASVPPEGSGKGDPAGKAGGEGVVIGGFRFSEQPGKSGKSTGNAAGAGFARSGEPRPDEWIPPGGYATPMQRLGAFVLDFLFLGAGTFFMTFVLALIMPGLVETEQGLLAVGNLLPFALALLYYAGLESSRIQATPGKLVLGFKVTGMHGERISFSRAVGRHFAKILSGVLFFVGYLMILFTRRRQGLHDLLAGCLAVQRVEGEETSGAGFRA